jgi:hypothetical protein
MRSNLLLTILLSLVVSPAFSQFTCATDDIHMRKMKEDTSYRKLFEQNQKLLQKSIQNQKFSRAINAWFGMQAATYTIPVVVHIIHTGDVPGTIYNPDDTRITQTIDYLNSVYNGTMAGIQGIGDIGIQFVLASQDPNCNPTNGITRVDGSAIPNYVTNGVNAMTSSGVSDLAIKSFANWDPTLYYNIYVVNKIDGNDGTSGTFVAGFATFPGEYPLSDGTVMLATQMDAGRKTLPHEIGHALYLHHPFYDPGDMTQSGNTCADNTDCNTGGDGVCDTDPIKLPPGFVCRTGSNNECTGTPFTTNTESNFMNYTACFNLFTSGQKDRMMAAMDLPSRKSLASSWAKVASYSYGFNSVTPASCTPVTASQGLSSLATGLIGLSVDSRNFSSGLTARDPGYVDKTGSCLHLIPVSRGASYTLSTDLYALNYEQVQAWIDYNDNGIFESTERVLAANDTPPNSTGYTTITTSFTVPTTAVTNKVLRMRVIEELSTRYGFPLISGPCYNPTYGQAEDYPLYVTSVLPLSWKYFRGTRNGNDVRLDWAVSNDVQNKYFEIEKSVDGTHFSSIGTVDGKANGSAYQFTDKLVSTPVNFYKLKQVSADGSFSYSNVVIVRMNEDSKTGLLVANPFSNMIELRFDRPLTTPAEISVSDISGKLIMKRSLSVGTQSSTIDLSGKHIAKAVYVLQARFENRVITKKIVKN